MSQRIPGKLDTSQAYNDSWRGWPVRPHAQQHPIRGSFLDPRPDAELGAIYHDEIDIAVRDDRPEQIERCSLSTGLRAWTATQPCEPLGGSAAS